MTWRSVYGIQPIHTDWTDHLIGNVARPVKMAQLAFIFLYQVYGVGHPEKKLEQKTQESEQKRNRHFYTSIEKCNNNFTIQMFFWFSESHFLTLHLLI